ncbi:MAG TPA: thiamine phosphate synthase [Cytophagales bacterium]|nr:thiamine phosphate synthase [Cytophagales bacterium]
MKKNISRFHFITHEGPGFSHVDLAEAACKGGADWIQLRVKDKGFDEWKSIALDVIEVCEMYDAKLIVNDNVELAAQIRAYGVHLGKTDMDPVVARQILGEGPIIGGTANTFEDVLKLKKGNVDYIGLGPFRFTSTKKNLSPVLGFEGYQRIINRMVHEGIDIPVVAIGGILKEDLNSLFSTGIHGVAISSSVSSEEDKEKATTEFLKTIKKLGYA